MGDISNADNFTLLEDETAFVWRGEGKIEAVIPKYEEQSVIKPESPTFWCLIICAFFSNHPEWLALRKQAVNLFLRQLNQYEGEQDDGAGEEEVQSGQEGAAAGAALSDSPGAAEAGDGDAEAPDDGQVPEEPGPS